jgi:hypothetical protein
MGQILRNFSSDSSIRVYTRTTPKEACMAGESSISYISLSASLITKILGASISFPKMELRGVAPAAELAKDRDGDGTITFDEYIGNTPGGSIASFLRLERNLGFLHRELQFRRQSFPVRADSSKDICEAGIATLRTPPESDDAEWFFACNDSQALGVFTMLSADMGWRKPQGGEDGTFPRTIREILKQFGDFLSPAQQAAVLERYRNGLNPSMRTWAAYNIHRLVPEGQQLDAIKKALRDPLPAVRAATMTSIAFSAALNPTVRAAIPALSKDILSDLSDINEPARVEWMQNCPAMIRQQWHLRNPPHSQHGSSREITLPAEANAFDPEALYRDAFAHALRDPSASVREIAVRYLSSFSLREITGLALANAVSPYSTYQFNWTTTPMFTESKTRLVEALKTAIGDSDANVRMTATRSALYDAPVAERIELIRMAMNSQDPAVTVFTMDVILDSYGFDDKTKIRTIQTGFAHPDLSVSLAAVKRNIPLLFWYGESKASTKPMAPIVERGLQSSDLDIAMTAVELSFQLPDEDRISRDIDITPVLRTALQSPDDRVVDRAMSVAMTLADRDPLSRISLFLTLPIDSAIERMLLSADPRIQGNAILCRELFLLPREGIVSEQETL